MTGTFTAGALVGIVATFTLYPVMAIIGAASVPFHRGDTSDTATAGLLFVARWTFYLTLACVALAAWGIGMLFAPRLVGTWTVTLTLLALGYAYLR